jgi:hypothetical protein
MAFIELSSDRNENRNINLNIKIMIFTEGTVLGPKNIWNLFRFTAYIPMGDCVSKILSWHQQGAEIVYCTSRKSKRQINQIVSLLRTYGFAGSRLYYRVPKQAYKDIVETVIPDILIEDDCKSIGGQWQMCITHVNPNIKSKIKSIAVKEFKGIDHLPDKIIDIAYL